MDAWHSWSHLMTCKHVSSTKFISFWKYGVGVQSSPFPPLVCVLWMLRVSEYGGEQGLASTLVGGIHA